MGYSVTPIGQWIDWVPTFTGFSADPSITSARYTLAGKMCNAYWVTGAGTSNATTLTITMPFAAKNSCVFTLEIQDAGTVQTGRASLTAGSNILTVLKANLGAFTASGNKMCRGFIMYEIE